MNNKTIRITLELPEDEASALAHLADRFSFSDAERLANAYDEHHESRLMLSSVLRLNSAFADLGLTPRA